MKPGPTVFAQIIAGLNQMEFSRAAARYPTVRVPRSLSAYDHFASMVFAQLTYRESLRAIETCLGSRSGLAYRMGIRGRVTRTNLAYANDHRDWRIFADVAAVLMRRARRLYVDTMPALGMEADLFALDATVIELSMSLFPWAKWKVDYASVKLNVMLDLRGNIPVFASIYEGRKHEVASLDQIPMYPGAYYVMDRGYLHFTRLFNLHKAGAFFVTRLKSNTGFYVSESRPIDEACGLRCDQTIHLNTFKGKKCFPELLRRISYIDPQTDKNLIFVTNQFAIDAFIITQLYKQRWAIETFFRWLKQHLRLRGFFSTSPNGVRVQIWSALCAYLLVAIAKQQKQITHSLWEILQVVSISSLEQIAIPELLTKSDTRADEDHFHNQLEINYS